MLLKHVKQMCASRQFRGIASRIVWTVFSWSSTKAAMEQQASSALASMHSAKNRTHPR